MKVCSKCNIPKELINFYLYKRTGKHFGSCKECTNRRGRYNWQEQKDNPEYRENRRKLAQVWLERNHARSLLFQAKQRSDKKGIPFSITLDDVVIPEYCPYLGIPLFRGPGKQCDNSPSIDEVIQGSGYVPGNIEVISTKANAMKRNASIDELRLFAHKILDKFGE